MGKQEVVFDYHVEGATLTGTVTVAGNSAEVEAGKATGDGFAHQFRMKTPMGRIRVQVAGKVEDDKISGDIKTPVGSVHFEGTRV